MIMMKLLSILSSVGMDGETCGDVEENVDSVGGFVWKIGCLS